jgi:hypothetical protein
VTLTIYSSLDLEVVVRQHHLAVHTCEASRMEFLINWGSAVAIRRGSRFKILALDTVVTARTKGSVSLVVMMFAVWLVVNDIEIGCSERLLACAACEALLVPSACQATIGCFHRLALDRFVAATANRPDAWSGWLTNWGRRTMGVRVWWREGRWGSSNLRRLNAGQRRCRAWKAKVV